MKLKGIVLVVILLLASIMMPFDVYADSISSSNINGVSVTLDEITFIENVQFTISGGTLTVQRNFYIYQGEIQFDKSYLGYVDISYKYYFTGRNDTGLVNYNQTINQKIFVNGDKAYFTFSFIANSSVDPLIYSSSSLTLNSSDLTEYGLLSDIETIIDILTENQDIINDIYAELQTVVSNTSLANAYLETLTKVRDFDVYFESYPFIIDVFRNNSFTYVDLANFYHLNYPIFSTSANTYITQYKVYRGNNAYVRIIFGTNNGFNMDNFSTYFNSNFELVELVQLNNYSNFRIYSLKFQNKTGSSTDFKLQTLNAINTFIPVYLNPEEYTNISTDFALLFGLSNQLLDDIHLIANGTNQSSSAASDLESSNSQLEDDMNDLATIESGYTQQFNNQLQSIDFTSPIQNNAGILPAANFVITIFNGLINNNPFSVLIIIVCILLIGKKVIGK